MKRGPKTPEGKARVRGNALKHGLTGDLLHLSAAEAATFEELKLALHKELAPVGTLEQIAADDIAVSYWRYMRALQWETTLFRRLSDSTGDQVEEDVGVPKKKELTHDLKMLALARGVFAPGGLSEEARDCLQAHDPELLKELDFRPADPGAVYAVLLMENMIEKAKLYPGLEEPKELWEKVYRTKYPQLTEEDLKKVQYVIWVNVVQQMQAKLLAREEVHIRRLWELADRQKLLQEQGGSGIDSATRYMSSIRKALYQAMSVFKPLRDSRLSLQG